MVGDQPYSGTKLIELPDLNEMLAEVKINEVDVSKILPGMKVIITPDAYSDTTYVGRYRVWPIWLRTKTMIQRSNLPG